MVANHKFDTRMVRRPDTRMARRPWVATPPNLSRNSTKKTKRHRTTASLNHKNDRHDHQEVSITVS